MQHQNSIKRLIRIAQEISDHERASSDAYTLHRILTGVPEGLEDLPAMQAFPIESNLDIMGGCNQICIFVFEFIC